ncbi:MAG TPA: restriction endonuclease [Puia sp.]
MVNYNYLNLTPDEFEKLARDLLQVRENLVFETFNPVKDRGIDFRYTHDNTHLIVQAKRYENYSQLKKVLPAEAIKAGRLKPTRYILVSTVDFTPLQKEEVRNLFKGLIHRDDDILGKGDLNNLLAMPAYSEVRKNHYKLWLAGTDVLKDLIEDLYRRKENNLARAELELIESQKRFYVQNNTFSEALDRLEAYRVVLISGAPGGGKTTLGRALISYFMAKEEYTDLVYVSSGIDQAWAGLRKERKQLFFFDDFLGSVSFSGFSRNEETLLTKFISVISSTPGKILILTTREYVLRQAQMQYPEIQKDFYRLSKCIVEPTDHSSYVRGKILYNHLFFSDLHWDQIDTLLSENNYRTIVNHPHYSPRLIDNYIKFASKSDDPYRFFQDFKNYLDHPHEFWKDVYRKQSPSSKLLLLVLLTMDEPAWLRHLKQAYDSAAGAYIVQFNDLVLAPETFRDSLKELSDTFLRLDLSEGDYIARFQNPSIKDFLLQFLREDADLIAVLIQGAVFLNQLMFVFGTKPEDLDDMHAENPLHGKSIVLTGQLRTLYQQKFLRSFRSLTLSTINSRLLTDENTCEQTADDLLTFKLLELTHQFGMDDPEPRQFVLSEVQTILSGYRQKPQPRRLTVKALAYLPALLELTGPFLEIDAGRLIRDLYDHIWGATEFYHLFIIGTFYPDAFAKFLKKKRSQIEPRIKRAFVETVDYYESSGLEAETDLLMDTYYEEIFRQYGLEVTEEFTKKLRSNIYREKWDIEQWEARWERDRKEEETNEQDLDRLFTSLAPSLSWPPAQK